LLITRYDPAVLGPILALLSVLLLTLYLAAARPRRLAD